MPDEATVMNRLNERMQRITESISRNNILDFRPVARISFRQMPRGGVQRPIEREFLSPEDKKKRRQMLNDAEAR